MDEPTTHVSLASRPMGPPVGATTFSQFFEHMSYATVGGLSAQVVVNPTMAADHHLQEAQIGLLRQNADAALAWADGDETQMIERWVSCPHGAGFSVTIFDDQRAKDVPLGWSALGDAGGVQMCAGRIGGGVRLLGRFAGKEDPDSLDLPLDGPYSGLRQAVYPPVRRGAGLDVTVVARPVDGAGILEVGLRRRTSRPAHGPAGQVLALDRRVVAEHSWAPVTVHLAAPTGLADNDPADLVIRWLPEAAGMDLVIDRVDAIAADHCEGFDVEVIELLREQGVAELRWPGGNFASYYHWRDGIGDPALRPTRPNYAWGGLEHNLIGTDEYIRLCRLIGAEPHITVNTGTGSPEEAAAWVEYCNGSAETPMGRLRAQNGHPAPYDVRIWELGNENYGVWQGGFVGSEENARRFAETAPLMRAASPVPLTLHACGSWFDFVTPRRGLDYVTADRNWHAELFRQAREEIDVISLHALPANDVLLEGQSENAAHEALMAQVVSAERAFLPELFAAADASQSDSSARGPLQVSITEWGPLGAHPTRMNIEGSAGSVWAAQFLAMLTRFGDRIAMASPNGLHHGGAIKKGAGLVYADPAVQMTQRCRSLVGMVPLEMQVSGPAFDVATPTDLGRPEDAVPYVDVSAYSGEEGAAVLLVSRRLAGSDSVQIALPESWSRTEARAELWRVEEIGDRACPARPQPVDWQPAALRSIDGNLLVTVPALSVVWLSLPGGATS